MAKLLRSQGIVAASLTNEDKSLKETRIAKFQNYLTEKSSVRVSKQALTTVATWADMHKKPILLGDLPDTLKRVSLIGADIDGTVSSLPLGEL